MIGYRAILEEEERSSTAKNSVKVPIRRQPVPWGAAIRSGKTQDRSNAAFSGQYYLGSGKIDSQRSSVLVS